MDPDQTAPKGHMAYNVAIEEVNIASHVVDHIKCTRNIFTFTLIKEGISPKIRNIKPTFLPVKRIFSLIT